MGIECDAGTPGSRSGSRLLRSWVLLFATLTVGLATGVPSAAAATSVHHPTSHTSVQWWVPFLIALAAVVVIFVLVRGVRVRRHH
jgi:hypothetical protein